MTTQKQLTGTTLKINFSDRERQTIAAVLNYDNFNSTDIQPDDIVRAYIIPSGMYRFVYLADGVEVSQPIYKDQYIKFAAEVAKRQALERQETEECIDIVDAQEAELITQYAGIWITPAQVIEKRHSYAEEKIYYKVSVGYTDKPVTIAISIDYFNNHIEDIQVFDREAEIEKLLQAIPDLQDITERIANTISYESFSKPRTTEKKES